MRPIPPAGPDRTPGQPVPGGPSYDNEAWEDAHRPPGEGVARQQNVQRTQPAGQRAVLETPDPRTMQLHPGLSVMAFSPDGPRLATAPDDNTARI